VLVVVSGIAGWRSLRAPVRVTKAPVTESRRSRESAPPAAELPPPTMATALAPPPEAVPLAASGMPDEDRARFDTLTHRQPNVSVADVTAAEGLYARYPTEGQRLLEATLLNAAQGERRAHRYRDAAAMLRRAAELQTAAAWPYVVLMSVLSDAGDWAGAEAAARAAIVREARNGDAWHGLGYALIRQDRNSEAAEALRTAIEIRPDANAQALLDRVAKGMADERGMTERDLSHFHVRYDGEEHEDIGREILRALEHHYATLVSALDYQPQATIPVILFSSQGYYNANGAAAWSGGNYDLLDGRIRVPIRGLTRNLTPDMESTLLHELTHAFVADRTRGVAPRDIQEGLAQYMEGERAPAQLTAERAVLFSDGRRAQVAALYLSALSFVEYLVAARGMGGMNDLLRAMGETGSVDEAFHRVYGQDFKATREAWIYRLRQLH
jgi:tetratricopeptide (TPR) repeat protein